MLKLCCFVKVAVGTDCSAADQLWLRWCFHLLQMAVLDCMAELEPQLSLRQRTSHFVCKRSAVRLSVTACASSCRLSL